MSNFTFLNPEFPDVWDSASRAEMFAISDARASCFYARRTIELLVKWMYEHDSSLFQPYNTKLVSLLGESSFKQVVPPEVQAKMDMIRLLGNKAVHGRAPTAYEALQATRELFHCGFWLAAQYSSSDTASLSGLTFDEETVRQLAEVVSPKSKKQLQDLETQLEQKDAELLEAKLATENYEEQIAALRAEIAEIKQHNAMLKIAHDYDEATTRDLYIDLLLKEAGWDPDFHEGTLKCREFEVAGMPNQQGVGFVDYVLWGSDGRPLAVVEAKRAKKDPKAGRQQAKLYADCLEKKFGVRPIIFYTNGYDHWIWDDRRYPPREIQGFLKEEELELAIQRRDCAADLTTMTVDKQITDRPYSEGAIRAITEGMMNQRRKALVVMATGTGKTRMAVALVDLLQRANWVKRVLFLADRVSLVKQGLNAFRKHLPQCNPVNLVIEKENVQSRVYGSTYQTMMGLIDDSTEGGKRFGAGHFDLVIIDEAHRSVYKKYGVIFEYFDSHLIGLTATPRDEVDRDTYGLFELPSGDPTFAYDLDEAIKDGHLVPPKLVSVPIKIPRDGINYDELSDKEKEAWDMQEWDEEGNVPERVEPSEINQWLFNIDTVDKVLEHVMTKGIQVDAGQKIGKTIIFAKNHNHAEFIAERFNANYPHYKGHFARVIDNQESYAETLIDQFSMQKNAPKDAPQIAISVDMLDTGIDVPDAVNLVFFKIVRSKTKFWQMIGRGTRKCEDLFGDGLDKEFFYVFDYCGNFEFFNENPDGVEGATQEAVTTRIFRTRLEILESVQAVNDGETKIPMLAESGREKNGYETEMGDVLHGQVASMNLNNFIVRRKRRYVDDFRKRERWQNLSRQDFADLSSEVADLPTEQETEHPTAKYFDLILLRIQLGMLQSDPGIAKYIERVKELAVGLEGRESIPAVAKQMVLIQEIQTDDFWEHVTLPILETVRKKLRDLIRHIEKGKRKIVITDVRDQLGTDTEVTLPEIGKAVDLADYRKRFERYIKEHENHITLQKVKMNEPLTSTDLEQLEEMLFESGELGSREDFEACYGKQEALGVFLRKLVGLDREAAKAAFGEYLDSTTFSSGQIQFINQIIEYLTKNGVMDPKVLFDHPFTTFSPQGPESLFKGGVADRIVKIIRRIRDNAVA